MVRLNPALTGARLCSAVALVWLLPSAALAGCTSLDAPNPIADKYPESVTGSINGTFAVVPIPLEEARRHIPLQYGILEKAYRALLPEFPAGYYPLVIQGLHEHDMQQYSLGLHIPDFSRAGWIFPFVDLLGDNSTSFQYSHSQLLSADNPIAIAGTAVYGIVSMLAVFDPPCDAYSYVPANRVSFFEAFISPTRSTRLTLAFSPTSSYENPYPLSFFRNVTNQPIFGNGSLCDNVIRLWNISNVPEPVVMRGTVWTNMPPLDRPRGVGESGVWGVQVNIPFVEQSEVKCENLRGYKRTGEGDSG